MGDIIPANAEIRVNVDRDWVEFAPATNPNAVYEITGKHSGEVIKKVADILKGKARDGQLSRRRPAARPIRNSRTSSWSRSTWADRCTWHSPDADDKDIKYGDVLDIKGKVTIIAINNTITLMNASGEVTTVIGPLKFDVEKVLTNQKLYKFLNVPR